MAFVDALLHVKDALITDTFGGADIAVIDKPVFITEEFYMDDIKSITFSGLQAHLKFKKDVLDLSGNGNNGTITGTETYTPGIIDKAFDFDGSTRINLANEANFDFLTDEVTPQSVSFWVK